jgi:glycosyltransferase involved in cell wall biosynthesis
MNTRNNKPLVSVIIPCYKQAVYLPDALDSLLAQTYVEWEGIIVNDGSPDNTEEVATAYLQKDKRFVYLSKSNGGISSARNVGIAQAKGEFILPLDADDRIGQTYIEKAIDVFLTAPATKLVYCKAALFGIKECAWEVSYAGYRNLLQGNSIFCSSLFRKADFLKMGGYDETMLYGYEDWEFYIRLLDDESIVRQLPEVLFYYRVKEISRNTSILLEQRTEDMENDIYARNIKIYASHFGSAISVVRELEYCRKELRDHKRNKWYRRLHRKLKRLFR